MSRSIPPSSRIGATAPSGEIHPVGLFPRDQMRLIRQRRPNGAIKPHPEPRIYSFRMVNWNGDRPPIDDIMRQIRSLLLAIMRSIVRYTEESGP